MPPSTIALIILLVTIIVFITETIHLCLTAMLSAIAMGIFGLMPWSDVFSGMSNSIVMFPIIDSLSSSSYGRISRKQLYLPTAVSTVFGSNITTIGSTSMMLAVGLLAESNI